VVNMLGNTVSKLYEGPVVAGIPYKSIFNAGDNLNGGIYVVVLRTSSEVRTMKVTLNR